MPRFHPLLPVLLVALAACASDEPPESGSDELAEVVLQAEIPAELAAGEAAFQANCATCHGNRGLGTEQGPPLVHIIYEPNHHADIAFFMAVDRGVRAHHWPYGDMPAQPHVQHAEVEAIVAYIRHLQRQVGIE